MKRKKLRIELAAVQPMCGTNMRGIAYYQLNLLRNLVFRGKNEYGVSFFDFHKERGNRQRLEAWLGDELKGRVFINECNDVDYRTIIRKCEENDGHWLGNIGYSELVDSKADLFHFPMSYYFPFSLPYNTVFTVHDVLPKIYKDYFSASFRDAFDNCHKYISSHKEMLVLTDSECTKRDLMKYYDIKDERITVVPLACDMEFYNPVEDKETLTEMGISEPYLLYLGALDIRKGIPTILYAYDIIKKSYRDIQLVIAGAADHDFLEKYGDEYQKVRRGVIYTGYVTDKQKRALLAGAEIFLFPSEYEGFGLPVLEAMACGTPVITSESSSLPEVGGDAAVYIKPGEWEDLAEKMEYLLSSEDIRNDYRKKGLERCRLFSWENTAEMTEVVYERALSNV